MHKGLASTVSKAPRHNHTERHRHTDRQTDRQRESHTSIGTSSLKNLEVQDKKSLKETGFLETVHMTEGKMEYG